MDFWKDKRRELLRGGLGALVLGISTIAGAKRIPFSAQTWSGHLDADTADQLVKERTSLGDGENGVFDLVAYATASLEAIQRLANASPGFVQFGFKSLDLQLATEIAAWEPCFLIFERLTELTPDVARALTSQRHSLEFPALESLDIRCARILATSDSFLSLGLCRAPPELGAVLAAHTHELYLRIPRLEVDLASSLSAHQGYRLSIQTRHRMSQQALTTFSAHPWKEARSFRFRECGISIWGVSWEVSNEWWTSWKPGSWNDLYRPEKKGG